MKKITQFWFFLNTRNDGKRYIIIEWFPLNPPPLKKTHTLGVFFFLGGGVFRLPTLTVFYILSNHNYCQPLNRETLLQTGRLLHFNTLLRQMLLGTMSYYPQLTSKWWRSLQDIPYRENGTTSPWNNQVLKSRITW